MGCAIELFNMASNIGFWLAMSFGFDVPEPSVGLSLCRDQAKVQSDVNRVAGVKLSNEWSINQFKCYYPHFSYDCRISEIDLNKSI